MYQKKVLEVRDRSREISTIPIEVKVKRRLTKDPLRSYGPKINQPIRTIQPAPALIGKLSSAPDPRLENIERVKNMVEKSSSGNLVKVLAIRDARNMARVNNLGHIGQPTNIDNAEIGGVPIWKIGLGMLGAYILWGKIKKL